MFDIRVFSVLDSVVVQVSLIERSMLGTVPPTPPTFLGDAKAPLDEVTGPQSLARVIYSAISDLWDSAEEFGQQLTG